MNVPIKITDTLKSSFDKAWKNYRILMFSAPLGYGKTSVCKTLLKRQKVTTFNCDEDNAFEKELVAKCSAVVVDDLQCIKPEDQTKLLNLIKSHEDIHFVLLSSGATPSWLMVYSLVGTMYTFDKKELLLDRQTIHDVLEKCGTPISEKQVEKIEQITCCVPLLVNRLCRQIVRSGEYSDAVERAALEEFYAYYDSGILAKCDDDIKHIMLSLAFFDSFDMDFVKKLGYYNDAPYSLKLAIENRTLFNIESIDTYSFIGCFRKFLIWKGNAVLTQEDRRQVYKNAAEYYRAKQEVYEALRCYVESGDMKSVQTMLEENAELNPSVGFYHEMQDYYFSLPEETAKESTSIMSALSMTYAMCLDYDKSDYWYGELQKCAKSASDRAERKKAIGKLRYLDIALPQRGNKGIIEFVLKIFKTIGRSEIPKYSFSVTSTLPSVMNGAKDFCEWSKRDDTLFPMLAKPIEVVLGADGVGLAECGMCESKFEKGEEISDRLLSLMTHLQDIQSKGTLDVEFAVMGLIVREQIKNGKPDVAMELLLSLKDKCIKLGEKRFFGNIDAMICRINLYKGDSVAVQSWIDKSAPKDTERLRSMWRMQYITKAMVEISQDKLDKALLTIAPLVGYCEKCERVMDKIYINELMAICYFRKGNERWKEFFGIALKLSHEYGFLVPIAQYGVAVLPLLKQHTADLPEEYITSLNKITRAYAVNYPRYMRANHELTEQLSVAEMQILKLLCENLSNNEICEILDIKLSTVKTHVGRVLQKLGVSRRNEVRDVAIKYRLI